MRPDLLGLIFRIFYHCNILILALKIKTDPEGLELLLFDSVRFRLNPHHFVSDVIALQLRYVIVFFIIVQLCLSETIYILALIL